MINSVDEFAKIWKKQTKELTQLDYFIFLLINELILLLQKEYDRKSFPVSYRLNSQQITELVVQLADGLHFFYEQICFGRGCSLGCPNKLDTSFSKKEEKVRFEIVKREFNGNPDACRGRKDCLRHDLMDYVVKDNLLDYYTFFMNIKSTEDDTVLNNISHIIVDCIINYTSKNGNTLLKEPDRMMKMKN